MPVLKQTATCFTPPCMCRYSCIFSEFILREISNGLSFYVLERENRKAPNQHRLLATWPVERGNTGPHLLPGALSHIHSKTACRGVSERQWRSAANRSRLPPRSVLGAPHRGAAPEPAAATKSFCPCHKTGENTGFSPVFFLHVLYGNGVHSGSDTGFSHLVLPVLNCCHPLQHPKRTRLRLFSPEIGCVFSFSLFFGCKIFVLVFVHFAAQWLQVKAVCDAM